MELEGRRKTENISKVYSLQILKNFDFSVDANRSIGTYVKIAENREFSGTLGCDARGKIVCRQGKMVEMRSDGSYVLPKKFLGPYLK